MVYGIDAMLPLAVQIEEANRLEREQQAVNELRAELELPAPAPWGLDDVGWDRYCEAGDEGYGR